MVVAASGHLKDPAHLPDSKYVLVVFHEPEYLLSLLEKMLTAFFRMSRSISASFRAFFNWAISRCSAVIRGFPLPAKLASPTALCSRLQRRTISAGMESSRPISWEDLPFRWSSTTISLKALSKDLRSLFFMLGKLRGLNSLSNQM